MKIMQIDKEVKLVDVPIIEEDLNKKPKGILESKVMDYIPMIIADVLFSVLGLILLCYTLKCVSYSGLWALAGLSPFWFLYGMWVFGYHLDYNLPYKKGRS